MTIARRPFVVTGVAAAVTARTAFAWPDRTLRLIVGFQAGGSNDVIARLLAERLRGSLGGATIIVENKPGAAGALAAGAALAARDGHTLLVMGDSFITSSLTNRSARYRPLRDFKMVGMVCEGPLVILAAQRAPFRDFNAFVTHVRANPGKVDYVTAGLGGQQHLVAEYVSAALKLDMTHVPMRGGSQATQDLLGGQVEAGILGLGPTLPHIRSGRLFALAVSPAARVPQLPDVPTLAESGLTGFDVSQWFGLAAPGDTSDATVALLERALAAVLDDEAVRRRLDEIGFAARPSTSAAFAAKVGAEEARWRKLIAERGLKFD